MAPVVAWLIEGGELWVAAIVMGAVMDDGWHEKSGDCDVRVRIPQRENIFRLVDSYVEFFNTMSNFEGDPHGGNLTFVECHVEYYTIS
jgi:hypothetical protein